MCRFLLRGSIEKELELFNEGLCSMEHGGPDHQAILSLETQSRSFVTLGHNRLSIIDLSEQSNQPFHKKGVYLVFNGEIYNYKELRSLYQLDCETEGDTEVILELYLKIGKEAFQYLDGEYAFVIYDSRHESIFAVRDPLGIKPLYEYRSGSELILSSEEKGILPFIKKDVDPIQLDNILMYGYPINGSIFQDIKTIHPGEVKEYSALRYGTFYQKISPKVVENLAEGRHYFPFPRKHIETAIENAVKKRMISDVPISVTLSGGVDSSIIAGLVAKHSTRPRTYTVGFKDLPNEFEQARRVAEYLGTEHTEVELEMDEIFENIDKILYHLEDPMDRGSSMFTYFLGRAIKEKVTLIGEGADECFGGYNRHQEILPEEIDEYKKEYLQVFNDRKDGLVGEWVYDWEDPNSILALDLMNEIPNYHNMRIDKLMMAHAVEARVPYLDPEVVKVAMETSFYHKHSPKKKVLREAFQNQFPDWMLNPEKKALKLPYDEFVMRDEVKETILKDGPFFSLQSVEDLYQYGETPPRNWGRKLWQIYLLNKWYELFIRK